jgi:hypothetical protein
MLQEVRRGNEFGVIYSLAFSRGGNWLACTSDSNFVHVFASLPTKEEVPLLLARKHKGTNHRRRFTPTPSPNYTFSENCSHFLMQSTATATTT